MKYLRKLTEIFLLIFVFFLPFQTKLVFLEAGNNFSEISLYLSHIPLLIALTCFLIYQFIERKEKEKLPIYWYFMLSLVFFYSFSLFFATDKMLAMYKVNILFLGVSLFYILRFSISEKSLAGSMISRLKIIYVFLSSVFIHAVLGLYQFLSQSTFANKYLGIAMHDPAIVGTSVIETVSGRWLRAYGGLDHPNILAGEIGRAHV